MSMPRRARAPEVSTAQLEAAEQLAAFAQLPT